MPQEWYPMLLEPHEEELGFGVFVGVFDTPLGFESPKELLAVLCPLDDCDALFKTLRPFDGMVVYKHRCFGSRGHPLDPSWYAVDDFDWMDAGSALKKIVAGSSVPYFKVRREKYKFKRG